MISDVDPCTAMGDFPVVDAPSAYFHVVAQLAEHIFNLFGYAKWFIDLGICNVFDPGPTVGTILFNRIFFTKYLLA